MAYFSLISFQAAQNPQAGGQVNLNEMVVKPLFDDMSIILLLIVPLLTMRLLAEEKKNGTIELLLTYPIREGAVVLGKFLATLFIIFILLALTAVNVFMISRFGVVEWGPVLTGYGGLILLAAGFISLGLFTSALTQNQIIAAVLGFGALLMFWIIGWAGSVSGPGSRPGGQLSLLIGASGSFYQRGAGHPGSYVLPQFFGIFYFLNLTLSGFTKNQGMKRFRISECGFRNKKETNKLTAIADFGLRNKKEI